MRKRWYDTAQICLNGHTINERSSSIPVENKDFCEKCGARTITGCEGCGAPIQGFLNIELVDYRYDYSPPSFCHKCGTPYPWTESRLEAAQELADELDDLTPREREVLKRSLDDLVADTPRTALAATTFKTLVAKAGPVVAAGFKEILIEVVTESAKRQIWG